MSSSLTSWCSFIRSQILKMNRIIHRLIKNFYKDPASSSLRWKGRIVVLGFGTNRLNCILPWFLIDCSPLIRTLGHGIKVSALNMGQGRWMEDICMVDGVPSIPAFNNTSLAGWDTIRKRKRTFWILHWFLTHCGYFVLTFGKLIFDPL